MRMKDDEGSQPLTEQERLKIATEFTAQTIRNEALLEEIVFILKQKLLDSGIKIHDVEQRLKKVDSVIDKCERKGIQDHNLLVDVVGARVVCLFRSDMARVAEVLANNFEIVRVDDKLSDGGPLGYQSTHYICKLPGHYKGPRYEKTSGVEFEIQVRTLCMHAWAAVSHHLDYKGDWDVPEELKRALSALGGLFYVADNQFEQFYSTREKSIAEAAKKVGPEKEQELNLDTLVQFLAQKFAHRKQPSTAEASKLVRELKLHGYKTIQSLDEIIDRGLEAFLQYERMSPPSSGKFYAVGALRIIDRLVNSRPSFASERRSVSHLIK